MKILSIKNTIQWQQAYQEVKDVLSTREDIMNSVEKKKLCQLAAKKRK